MSIKGRVTKLEAIQGSYREPRIQFVHFPGDLPADELESHRQAVREAAAHPNGILIVYQGTDGDSLTDLLV